MGKKTKQASKMGKKMSGKSNGWEPWNPRKSRVEELAYKIAARRLQKQTAETAYVNATNTVKALFQKSREASAEVWKLEKEKYELYLQNRGNEFNPYILQSAKQAARADLADCNQAINKKGDMLKKLNAAKKGLNVAVGEMLQHNVLENALEKLTVANNESIKVQCEGAEHFGKKLADFRSGDRDIAAVERLFDWLNKRENELVRENEPAAAQ